MDHYIAILSDVSGKGFSAALLSIIVASLFENYCNNYSSKDNLSQNRIIEDVNEVISKSGFLGKFAALQVLIINVSTGKTWICNAGDDVIHYYNHEKKNLDKIELAANAAAGVFPLDLIKMQGGFKQDSFQFALNDILFLCTDGIEESQRAFLDAENKPITCEGCDFSYIYDENEPQISDTHEKGSRFEELGLYRMKNILSSIIRGESYQLTKSHNPFPQKELTFNFSDCKESLASAVLGLMAIERIFRIFPDPKAGPEDRIMIERKIDDFLRRHFDQYKEYFKYPVDHPDFSEYIYYTHLKETVQYDDFAILAIKLKPGNKEEESDPDLEEETDEWDELEELGVAVEVEELEELDE